MAVMDRFRLDGKVAFITGAGRNLGKQMALTFAEAGADVVVTSRTRSEIEATADEIRKLGRKALARVMDVTRLADVEQVVQEAISEFGRIDILVNNSATRSNKSVLEMPEQEWRDVIDTNLTGAFFCCKAVGPFMIKQGGGRLINLSSLSGVRGRANRTAYSASKAALISLTQCLAVEWAPHNILVNAVSPGKLATDRWHKAAGEYRQQRNAQSPLKRPIEFEEVVPLVLYLASDACTFMTGEFVGTTVNLA